MVDAVDPLEALFPACRRGKQSLVCLMRKVWAFVLSRHVIPPPSRDLHYSRFYHCSTGSTASTPWSEHDPIGYHICVSLGRPRSSLASTTSGFNGRRGRLVSLGANRASAFCSDPRTQSATWLMQAASGGRLSLGVRTPPNVGCLAPRRLCMVF